MANKTFQLQTPTCQECSGQIIDAVESLPGVEAAEVDLATNQVSVSCRDTDCQLDTVSQTIEKLGFKLATN